jgi:hypothetical protein
MAAFNRVPRTGWRGARMRNGLMALGAALAATIAVSASAQVAPTPSSPPTAPELDASVSAEAAYDTNVAESGAAIAAARKLQLQDEIFTPTLTLNLARPFGREYFFLYGDAGYDFYVHNTILDRERLDLHSGLGGGLGPCRAQVTGGYERHQSDLNTLTTTVVRNTWSDASVGVSGACPRTIGFGPTFSVSEDWASNSNPTLISTNYRTLAVTGGLAYTRPVFGVLSLYGEYDQTIFPNRLAGFGPSPITNGYQLYSGGVRYERKLGARIEGTFSVAYTSLRPDVAGVAGFNGATYAVDVTFKVTGKIGTHVHFDRAARPSVQLDTTYSIDNDYLAEATYAISSRMTLHAGGTVTTRSYAGPLLDPAIDLTHEQLNDLYATLDLNLGRRLDLLFDVRQENRIASISAYSYNSTRVSVTATSKF